jgi:uncharacterized protein (TIGR02466 family)
LANNLRIRPDSEKLLTTGQELDLLRAAYRRSPAPHMRVGICRLLMLEEAFADVVEVLTGGEPLDYRCEMILANAYLAAETADTDLLARAAANRALGLAESNVERSGALATRGKCETRLGEPARALATLGEALALDPHNRDACKRIAALELEAGRPQAVLDLTGDLLTKGANHARLFAAESLAHARDGDIAAARRADGFDAFHLAEQLAPPPGWETIEAFNAALAEELLAHPGIRYERYGSASELTWRIENPARANTPLFKLLLAQIIAALERHAVRVGRSDHPWAAAVPQQAFVRNWCVITESEGFETWHVHQFGWLSGVYYVRIPDSIAQGSSLDGCLAFGLPAELAGTEGAAAFGEHVVRPREGLMMTFPSQCYHRTYPHGTREKRICVAFDLRPE